MGWGWGWGTTDDFAETLFQPDIFAVLFLRLPSMKYINANVLCSFMAANWEVDDEGDYQLCGNGTGTG